MCQLPNRREVEGSALRAMNSKIPFTKYFFIEKNKKYAQSLEIWVNEKLASPEVNIDSSNVHVICGDCNVEIHNVLSKINKGDPIFALIDPEGLEINWNTIQTIGEWYKSEVLVTFPYNMAIARNVSSKLGHKQHEAVTRFIGSGWEKIRDDREARRISAYQARKLYVDLFLERLKKAGFKYPSISNVIKDAQGHPYYYLIFGSHSSKGKAVMNSVLKTKGEQSKLNGFNF